MNIDTLRQVREALNEAITLPLNKAPDLELWLKLVEARSAVDVQIYKDVYKATGKLPEVAQ